MVNFGSIYSIENGFVVAYDRAVPLPKHALEAMVSRVAHGVARAFSGETWKEPPAIVGRQGPPLYGLSG